MVIFTDKMSGLYIHIPYCKQACNYCDFHFSTSLKSKPKLLNALVQEIEIRKDYLTDKCLQTLYFGGGTPSLLMEEDFINLFKAIKYNYTLEPTAEITIECNPDDVTPNNLILWKSFGFNRLSIGLQSFNDEELAWMNRAHNAQQSLNCVELAKSYGFNNISIDLIYGSKFQTQNNWIETLKKAISLNIQHISAYNLTIEKDTSLGRNATKGNEPIINDELSAWQFEMLIEKLKDNGFIHYEISNFCKDGCIAKHNSNYWKQKPYIGIGPSAHSFNLNSRQWNIKNNNSYIDLVASNGVFYETEFLTKENRFNEYILTGLRTIWGCSLAEIENSFGLEIKNFCLEVITKNKKHLLLQNDTFCLTDAGKLYADKLSADFFI